jgi:hypothetical protein
MSELATHDQHSTALHLHVRQKAETDQAVSVEREIQHALSPKKGKKRIQR